MAKASKIDEPLQPLLEDLRAAIDLLDRNAIEEARSRLTATYERYQPLCFFLRVVTPGAPTAARRPARKRKARKATARRKSARAKKPASRAARKRKSSRRR